AIEKAVKRKAYDSKLLLKQPYLLKIAKSYKFPSIEELYVAVGYGGVPSTKVANMLVDMLREEENEELKREQQEITVAEFEKANLPEDEEKRRHNKKDATGVNVKGVDGLMIKFAKCCTPVPGDEIVGYITKGRGISVHRKDCANMMSLPEDEKGRFIDVEWDADALNKHSFEADIFVLAEDRKRLIMDISIAVQEMDVNVRSMNVKTTKDKKAMFNMTLDITEPDQIRKVLLKIKNVDGIIDAYRATT
ncbi:MAG: bifunctional (p)ppGpp synthetase/guanosine-3',5'-bis(diphosphate) 3'-pyrophosphohydrolase, partial [Firmicutes bacterium]|nr:bifunctional (p)ppGpp synthetase/guanosine-3',5'-bis(diphosphate) 3'-pyrophosphohydrolase [Bacillota bacterium]